MEFYPSLQCFFTSSLILSFLGLPLTKPLIRCHGKLEEASWDEAMDLIVKRSQEIRDKYTSGAIAFYTTGQFFLEEYYTLALIGKGG